MMALAVIDASVALSFMFADEGGDAARLAELAERTFLLAPPNFRMEVLNAIATAVRSGRIGADGAATLLRSLEEVGVVSDAFVAPAPEETLRLSILHHLTAYDAAYLELARRMEVPLATLDAALLSAAEREGVLLVSLRN